MVVRISGSHPEDRVFGVREAQLYIILVLFRRASQEGVRFSVRYPAGI